MGGGSKGQVDVGERGKVGKGQVGVGGRGE